ncbi:MAG: protein-L-isoaspartate(D-aspartate) O-methyltransferase [Sphingomonadales bacterium]|nr:protein-L-isoaspartate(D-aspartate) O-methyltransferase [Sphingomonadales bacterium]
MFTNPSISESPVMAGRRNQLVAELRQKGIADEQVLQAIGRVPRQLFFPKDFEQFVYRDAPFPIGHGQTISQPYTVAFQSQLLQIKPGDKVLEIGTGSGYQAAVLSAMGARVYTIETVLSLLKEAHKVLKILDNQLQCFHGDGTLGLPASAPYDAIIVTAGAPELPKNLTDQLAVNGRLIIPIGDQPDSQTMYRFTKNADGTFKKESFGPFRFVPLKGKEGWN